MFGKKKPQLFERCQFKEVSYTDYDTNALWANDGSFTGSAFKEREPVASVAGISARRAYFASVAQLDCPTTRAMKIQVESDAPRENYTPDRSKAFESLAKNAVQQACSGCPYAGKDRAQIDLEIAAANRAEADRLRSEAELTMAQGALDAARREVQALQTGQVRELLDSRPTPVFPPQIES